MLDSVPAAPGSVPLIAFVRDLTRYARDGAEADARRALCAPFSGVPGVDGRAACVVAGERRTIREVSATEPPLRAFLRALDAVATAYRAQGATVAEHVATIALGFGFDEALDRSERTTLAAIDELARRQDATSDGGAWDARPFLDALEQLARTTPKPAAPNDPQPLAERSPEAPANVRRRRSHSSASSLGMYAECERRWFYRYVCEAVDDPGSPASFYGTAFHWALERFHLEYPSAQGVPQPELERKLEAHLGVAFDRFRSGFETPVAYELNYRRAKRTARRYVRWFLERSRARPFTVIGTETNVELELEGYSFIGYIDRLDRDDASGAVTVLDYKTGSIAESAREYRQKVARFADFQLPFYYWARTAAGDRVTRLALVPLKTPSIDVRPIELEVVPVAEPPTYSDAASGTIGIDELERARTKMVELAAHLGDGSIERFAATRDAAACTFCSYRAACRMRPAAGGERFGR